MYRELTNLAFCLVLVLALSAGAIAGDPFRQDTGPDGIVSMEAENFDENIPRPPHTWDLITTAANGFAPPGGFSGGYAMQSTPTTPAGGDGFNDPRIFLRRVHDWTTRSISSKPESTMSGCSPGGWTAILIHFIPAWMDYTFLPPTALP